MEIKFDNYKMTADKAADLQAIIKDRIEAGLIMRISERPSYYPTLNSPLVSVSITDGKYFLTGQHADDEGVQMYIGSADEPGNWLCWDLESVKVGAYLTSAQLLRGFDVQVIISPRHDSHARFAKSVVMMTGRVGLDNEFENPLIIS